MIDFEPMSVAGGMSRPANGRKAAKFAPIKIESGVPVPSRRYKYPWSGMKPGQSFFVPGGETSRVSAAAVGAKKRGLGMFTVRKQNGGVRVWRVA